MTHRGDADFLAALDELRALHLSKGHDYADEGDPLRNYVESARSAGLEGWQAAWLRLAEKFHRFSNLTRKGTTPKHEALEDTLMDLAALALIVRSLRRRQAQPDALTASVETIRDSRITMTYDDDLCYPVTCHCGRKVTHGPCKMASADQCPFGPKADSTGHP